MLNNRFFILKKPKLAYVYYHYDSLFQGDFSKKYTYFKTKWLINKPLKQKTYLILKQNENFRRLNTN